MSRKLSIEHLAPSPERVEDATAEGLAKQYAAFAHLNFRLGLDHPNRDKANQSMGMFTSFYAIAFLCRQLKDADVELGDRVARDLWEAWDNPHTLGPDVWAWLTEYGIDPEQVNRIAEQLIAEDARREAADKRWDDAVDWLLNSGHTADPEIQAAFWGVVNGQCTRDDADRGYLADGTRLSDLPNEEV